MPGLSIRGYARHRGVSHSAVRKALAAGRITAAADGTIEPQLADEQWASSTNLSKPRNSVTGTPKRARRAAHSAPTGPHTGPAAAVLDPAPEPAPEAGATRLVSSYAASRAARESYLARLAKLEFEVKSGKLVDADEVRAHVFGLGRRLRDSLLGMPDRLAPMLVGQTDQAAIHRLISDELRSSLAELSAAPPLRFGPKQEPER